jgi:hypothetical protein
MSDLMGDPGAKENVKSNMSIFNPVDIAAMKTPGNPGQIDPQTTTIREFFDQQGVDVDGPLVQLVRFAQNQRQKANPINKMQGIAQGASGQAFPGMTPDPGAAGAMANRKPQGRRPEVGLEELSRMM